MGKVGKYTKCGSGALFMYKSATEHFEIANILVDKMVKNIS